MGQFLSQARYLTVTGFRDSDNMYQVRNQAGHTFYASKRILESMYSAQHFAKEVALTMTGLVELLQNVQDVVFIVNFRK